MEVTKQFVPGGVKKWGARPSPNYVHVVVPHQIVVVVVLHHTEAYSDVEGTA